jgi:ABC-type nitrate/sulfonate/bicarbonate transport system permease component
MSAAIASLRILVYAAIAVMGLIAAWDAAIAYFRVPLYLMPPPGDVWEAMARHRAVLLTNTLQTLSAAAAGLVISTAFATSLALWFSGREGVQRTMMPFLIALRTAPVVAVAPLITLMVGRGLATSIVVVTIVTFFPLLVNLIRGLSSAEKTAIEMMHVLGARRWQVLYLVRIPTALPYLFAGLRIAMSGAILGAMLAEWLTGVRGLGYLILDSADMREVELLWASIAVSMVVALTAFWLTASVERAVVRWSG